MMFSEKVEENLFHLIADLESGRYAHGEYIRFCVRDPKRREIAKASVRDRIFHRAIWRVMTPIFDASFIFDSFSSRKGKGTHKARERFCQFAQKLARNYTKTVWVLQLDIRKFFDSVDQVILLTLLRKKIKDEKAMKLIETIISSFAHSVDKGIPLGNITSQLFSNVYLDPLDQFVKRELRVKNYIRYADDIAIFSRDRNFLENCLQEISVFVGEKLGIELHPQKISLKKWHEGIDFLGYVHFPFHSVLRTKTKLRIVRNMRKKKAELALGVIEKSCFGQSMQSYLGMLKHCRGKEIRAVLADL